MYTFLANLVAYLERRGIAWTRALDPDADVLFANSWVVPYATLARAKRRSPALRVVHRIDGAAQDYGRPADADREQARANLVADLTVFQSCYARHACTEKFRIIANDGPVIYNPVDVATFAPDGDRAPWAGERRFRARIASVAWSTNRRKGTWRIDDLAAAHPDLEFVLGGRFEGIAERPNVRRLGHLTRSALAAALRSCDLFLDLSENEACPNVVLEALASGLPVVHRDSGGVPELVGGCGAAWTTGSFGDAIASILGRRGELAHAARARAVETFSPDVVFPRYLEAIACAERHPVPGLAAVASLARRGYPVLASPSRAARAWAGAAIRRGAGQFQDVVSAARGRSRAVRIGWVTYDAAASGGLARTFGQLESFTRMRAGQIATWINRHTRDVWNELYRPGERYDVVVFQKVSDERALDEAARARAAGARVVFDANVNYYEIWGDYFIPGTEPTGRQREHAIAMTASADWVVADSRYLETLIRRHNGNVTWIPDNVDLETYGAMRAHEGSRLRIVWSGIAKKAAHLLLVRDVLAELGDAELVLVCDARPDVLSALEPRLPSRWVSFSDRAYAALLAESDVIISPKRLVNAYEMAHTEYKITLGMACGLPAIASPQPSYVDALADGGGLIARSDEEWLDGFRRLRDAGARRAAGAAARRTVETRYSTAVVAGRYLELLRALAAGRPADAAVADSR